MCFNKHTSHVMKKQIIVIIITVLCFGLGGCSSDKSQYDENMNQYITFQGICFQVPKEWEKPDIKFDKFIVAFAEWTNGDVPKNYLTVTFSQGENLSEHIDLIKRAKNVEIYEQSNASIENMQTKKIKIVKGTKDGKYYFQAILLQTKKGVIEMAFKSINRMGYSDFDKVVNSIKVE